MDTENLGVLAGIIISLGFFALIFSVFYLYKREKMAMIERGMDPRSYKSQPAPFKYLKWAFLLMGAGLGLFLATLLNHYIHLDDDDLSIYFSLIGIFGGLGLYLSYRIEKKETLDKE